MEVILLETNNQMQEVILHYQREISKIRTGRANPNILDNIHVSVYGSHEALLSVAAIKVPEPRQLLIKPYDRNIIKNITEAINKADLKLQIKTETDAVRLIFPFLTEDVRKSLVRDLNKITEEFKIKIRNIRRDAIHNLKKLNLPEDQLKVQENKIQDVTNKNITQITEIEKVKEQELMQI